MSPLADALVAAQAQVLDLFKARVRATVAPPAPYTEGELADHLPDFLAEVASALREGASPGAQILAPSATGGAHGHQRLRLGFDVNAVVREYGLLHDCVVEAVERAGVPVSLGELRALAGRFSAAAAEAVKQHTAERQQAAERERLHLLNLMQQALGFIAFLRGPDHVFELPNAAYYQHVGHRPIEGKSVREALPELAGQGFFELLDQVYRTGEPFVGRAMPVRLQREPGAPPAEAFADFIYQPIRDADGAVVGILVQGNEVSELKRQEAQREAAEAALRASDARYRTLFESIDDGYCLLQLLFDPDDRPVDYRFLETNAAFEAQSGLKDALGKTARELVPDLNTAWFEVYGAVAITGRPTRFESHAPAMGRWFETYASRVGDPALRQVAVVFKDVTARKEAEAERDRLLALERAARAQAEEASRLKDDFLATVSHELRTPLNAILGWVQMLRAGGLPPERADRALETVERNARAQAQLIEDLLDVSRILAGKLRLEVAPVEVSAVVAQAVETVRPAAEAKGIRLHAVLDSEGTIMGDAARLQQVVWNLLSNAVKFTPKGGSVQALVERRDSSVEITIADSGRGIDAAFLPHVFERFRQAEGGATRAHGGLGLGLSIVRQIVEMHGGTVGAFSAGEGRGASFTVRLPVSAAQRREVEPPLALQRRLGAAGVHCPPELAGLRVLVVDDEEDARELLQTLLEGCGARVTLAASAAEALRLCAAEPPDLVLSDVGMPREDGYSLLEKVRALPPPAGDVPAVAITAYARSEDRTRALLAGFQNHVPKPVEPMELLAVIASLARRGR